MFAVLSSLAESQFYTHFAVRSPHNFYKLNDHRVIRIHYCATNLSVQQKLKFLTFLLHRPMSNQVHPLFQR